MGDRSRFSPSAAGAGAQRIGEFHLNFTCIFRWPEIGTRNPKVGNIWCGSVGVLAVATGIKIAVPTKVSPPPGLRTFLSRRSGSLLGETVVDAFGERHLAAQKPAAEQRA